MSALYIHIPYCKRKCSYCDFFSVANTKSVEAYIAAVAKEAALRKNELQGVPPRTIYIGGGTPSVLSASQMERIVRGVAQAIPLHNVDEFTVEVNPEGVTTDYICALKALGVNRVSMGVQSLIDGELALINRRHTAAQAVEAMRAIRAAGISNISIDLIYGLPSQSHASWQQSLREAIALQPEHVSAYCLSYEPGTRLTVMRDLGKITETSDEDCEQMFFTLVQTLKDAGYEHYELSNFALPGRYSKHNSSYWDGTIYLGLGAAAHSFDGDTRSWNPRDILAYTTAIEAGNLACEREILTATDKYNEQIMTRLRTAKGISADYIAAAHGEAALRHFERAAAPFLASGKMRLSSGTYTITLPGLMTSDAIISELMIVSNSDWNS